ncbi:hypothetical protein CQW23_12555 [Capsicum baccatum]|uniref:Histone H2A C-terminal domain-containing protein n=1 Tax=Capsicum baccatum TaxID=33114 RepID=A0A2G2WSX9_CAPBA|nr:hypothetical protein CQW23_12555 [Capsicum baccatum]
MAQQQQQQHQFIALQHHVQQRQAQINVESKEAIGELQIKMRQLATTLHDKSQGAVLSDTYTPKKGVAITFNDEELSKLLGDVTIAAGGVMPSIHNLLLPN